MQQLFFVAKPIVQNLAAAPHSHLFAHTCTVFRSKAVSAQLSPVLASQPSLHV